MNKISLTLTFAIVSNMAFAANASDSLRHCLNKLQATDAKVQTLQRENETLKSDVVSLNANLEAKSNEIDSLKNTLMKTNRNVAALADSLNINISNTQAQIQSNSESLNQTINKKSQTGLWIFIVLALVVAVIAFVFGRLLAKRGNEVASLSAKTDKLNEEIVERMSKEMTDMQNISKQISSIASTPAATPDTEQKLITTLADRITFMEMTLYKMDSSVRGHKQLSRSIKQMKDNLLANGYELVEMLGKDYHDGMKVTANFVEDEELPEGKQIITGIIKPQINYKGKMIQSAQITVSQNL